MSRFRRLAVLILSTLVLSVAAESPAAVPPHSARASVFADFGCRGPAKRPRSIVLTCADAGLIVHKIHWSRWGGRVAKGTGTVTYNDCDPFCAGGHFHSVAARLSMTRIGFCSNTSHEQYHRLTIRSRAFRNRRHLYRRTVRCHTLGTG